MKKIFIAALAAALAFNITSKAQSFADTRLGIIGGLTSSSTTIKDVDTKSISLYHAGVALEIPLGGGLAIQPEVLYQLKGLSFKELSEAFETRVGYMEIPVQIQWGPDLMVFRPYGFIEPFVGFKVSDKAKGAAKTVSEHLQGMEYGLGVGAGIELFKLQLSAKYFWNFGGIYDSELNAAAKAIAGLKEGNNFNGVVISLGLFF